MGWLPCRIHAYAVYTSIGGKGRYHTRCDLQDHCMQARKSSGERSTPDLRPVRKDTQSPKQEQSVTPQLGLGPTNFFKKNRSEKSKHIYFSNFFNDFHIALKNSMQSDLRIC